MTNQAKYASNPFLANYRSAKRNLGTAARIASVQTQYRYSRLSRDPLGSAPRLISSARTRHYQYYITYTPSLASPRDSVKPFVYTSAYNAPAHLAHITRPVVGAVAGTIASSPPDNRYGRSDVSSSDLPSRRYDSSETITCSRMAATMGEHDFCLSAASLLHPFLVASCNIEHR